MLVFISEYFQSKILNYVTTFRDACRASLMSVGMLQSLLLRVGFSWQALYQCGCLQLPEDTQRCEIPDSAQDKGPLQLCGQELRCTLADWTGSLP